MVKMHAETEPIVVNQGHVVWMEEIALFKSFDQILAFVLIFSKRWRTPGRLVANLLGRARISRNRDPPSLLDSLRCCVVLWVL